VFGNQGVSILGIGQDFLQEMQIVLAQPFALIDAGLEFQ